MVYILLWKWPQNGLLHEVVFQWLPFSASYRHFFGRHKKRPSTSLNNTKTNERNRWSTLMCGQEFIIKRFRGSGCKGNLIGIFSLCTWKRLQFHKTNSGVKGLRRGENHSTKCKKNKGKENIKINSGITPLHMKTKCSNRRTHNSHVTHTQWQACVCHHHLCVCSHHDDHQTGHHSDHHVCKQCATQ